MPRPGGTRRRAGSRPESQGGLISQVAANSVGDEIGLEPRDILISINGHVLRDVIDYEYYADDDTLVLVVERAGERHTLDVELDYDETLGLEFAEPVFDGMRLCRNRCPFCFLRQLPKGLRRSLYLRDDDYRYSFLSASYITLTNLTEADWSRIGEQHLSPLYVSIHATDDVVRRHLLGNPDAPAILPQLRRLGDMGIEVHGQIVVVPGQNDGDVLWRTVDEVAGLWPTVRTLALVPVGITSFHCERVRPLERSEAADIIDAAMARIPGFSRERGTTWLYPSDEMLLCAGREVPDAAFYDNRAQRENGVGLVRELLDDWAALRGELGSRRCGGVHAVLVCGKAIEPTLSALARELAGLCGAEIAVVAVENKLFGPTVTVSGLLAGADVLSALDGVRAEHLFLPRVMFDQSGDMTLDDVPLSAFGERLATRVHLVSTLSQVVDVLVPLAGRR